MSCEAVAFPHGEALPDADIVRVIQELRYECLHGISSDGRDRVLPHSTAISDESTHHSSYKLTIGLILRALSGIKRVVKRCLVPPPSNSENDLSVMCDNNIHRLDRVLRYFTLHEDIIIIDQYYSPKFLFEVANELKMKLDTLSPKLLAEYHRHPLLPPHPTTNKLVFEKEFLVKVYIFHNQVRRPDGAFDLVDDELIPKLAVAPRDLCPKCGSRRQLYCGDCGGIRLTMAESILPKRISLPFDVLLIIHWQESWHKCTGMQAVAMAQEGQISYVVWPRIVKGGDATPIIEGLDPSRDILLFPSKEAVAACDFKWTDEVESNVVGSRLKKSRLVVLEASWNHGKTMANQIIEYRMDRNLQPIPCVVLEDVVGQYWRFQREGHGALSTVEAIAYTAAAAGLEKSNMNELLCLFHAQKYRVLDRVANGGIAPQAIAVEGSGVGSWKEYTDSIKQELETNS